MFKAIYVTNGNNDYRAVLTDMDEQSLPPSDVTIDVEWSSLNYKDALAITGKAPIIRRFPMVPGIDLAGTVTASQDASFREGQQVLSNGWGLGENHWGGLAQRASADVDWLTPLPEPLTTRDAMSLGTAGFTAMLCVQALERHGVTPDQGEVLVTGATGGVGSVAVYLLARRGFKVVASTGHTEEEDYLRKLGATGIIDRTTLSEPGPLLTRQHWAGAVDVAGSHTLANVCAGMQYGGVVAACGLAQGGDFPASVVPFILRGIQLIGINSVYCPYTQRVDAWQSLARDWDPEIFAMVVQTIGLTEVIDKAHELLEGKVRGRILVDVNV